MAVGAGRGERVGIGDTGVTGMGIGVSGGIGPSITGATGVGTGEELGGAACVYVSGIGAAGCR